MKIRIHDWWIKYWIWLAAGAITGIYAIITRWGAVVGFDSFYYLASAQGILDGHGIGWIGADGVFVPLTHYPPLYPLVIALVSFLTGSTILQGARILVLISVFCSVIFTGKLIHTHTSGWIFPLVGMMLFLLLAPFQVTLISAMTESVFLALLCGFLFVISYPAESLLRKTLIGSGLISLMLLTRFAAVAVLGGYVLYLLVNRELPLKKQLVYIFTAGLIAIIPAGMWLWSRTPYGDVTGRTMLFHPPSQAQYRLAWETILAWFVPEWDRFGMPILARIGIILILVMVLLGWARSFRNKPGDNERKSTSAWLSFSGIYLVLYPVFLWFSYSFMDASTRWTTRILSPWLFLGMLILLVGIQGVLKQNQHRWVQGILLAGCLIWVVANGINAVRQARDLVVDGDGFTARVYQKSELMQQVRQLDKECTIYTNSAPAIYFNTGKLALSIPEKKDTIQAIPNPAFAAQLEQMKVQILSGEAVLVIFRPYDDKNGVYPSIDELAAQLREGYKSKEGIIFH